MSHDWCTEIGAAKVRRRRAGGKEMESAPWSGGERVDQRTVSSGHFINCREHSPSRERVICIGHVHFDGDPA